MWRVIFTRIIPIGKIRSQEILIISPVIELSTDIWSGISIYKLYHLGYIHVYQCQISMIRVFNMVQPTENGVENR